MGQNCCSGKEDSGTQVLVGLTQKETHALTYNQQNQKNLQVKSHNIKDAPQQTTVQIETAYPGTENKDNTPVREGISPHAPTLDIAKKVESFPNFFNNETQAKYDSIDEFDYEKYNIPNNKAYRVLGPYKYTTGSVYLGQYKDGLKHGRGKLAWDDGSYYEGSWRSDLANGKGRLIHKDGDVYEGDFVDNKAQGEGQYTHANGVTYVGSFKHNLQEGEGVETWPDGSKFKGIYINGEKTGTGKFEWYDKSSYEGDFKNNRIEGKGIYRWDNHRTYSGDWVDNQMHGKGIFTWENGKQYNGQYVNDIKHGYGTFTWPGGRSYTGYFENGERHGIGYYRNSKGQIKKGEWINGQRTVWIEGDVQTIPKRVTKFTSHQKSIDQQRESVLIVPKESDVEQQQKQAKQRQTSK